MTKKTVGVFNSVAMAVNWHCNNCWLFDHRDIRYGASMYDTVACIPRFDRQNSEWLGIAHKQHRTAYKRSMQ